MKNLLTDPPAKYQEALVKWKNRHEDGCVFFSAVLTNHGLCYQNPETLIFDIIWTPEELEEFKACEEPIFWMPVAEFLDANPD